jgi:hypothetical protein
MMRGIKGMYGNVLTLACVEFSFFSFMSLLAHVAGQVGFITVKQTLL